MGDDESKYYGEDEFIRAAFLVSGLHGCILDLKNIISSVPGIKLIYIKKSRGELEIKNKKICIIDFYEKKG